MKKIIHIIIPCRNEKENLIHLIEEVETNIEKCGKTCKFLFIDDGSDDGTFNKIKEICKSRKNVMAVKLSRNFGKEAALKAGLEYCTGDAAIIMDGDLQHPPHLIPHMIEKWEEGAEIVDAIKVERKKEGLLNRLLSPLFNKLFSTLTGIDFKGASDFKLLDKKAIDVLNKIEEKNRFYRGLTDWIGLKHEKVEFDVQERKAGKSKWGLYKLVQLSVDAIISYSSTPLQIVTVLGIFSLGFSVFLGLQTLYNKFFGNAVSGFTTVILVVLIMSSIIMISLGLVGLYLAKIYNEVKNRPIYIVEVLEGFDKDNK